MINSPLASAIVSIILLGVKQNRSDFPLYCAKSCSSARNETLPCTFDKSEKKNPNVKMKIRMLLSNDEFEEIENFTTIDVRSQLSRFYFYHGKH